MLHFVRRPKLCYMALMTLVLFGIALLVYNYHTTSSEKASIYKTIPVDSVDGDRIQIPAKWRSERRVYSSMDGKKCNGLRPITAVDINTPDLYPKLNFHPRSKTYWNYTFEKRYLRTREQWSKLPLKVIVIPHSHNDPGWLMTFDDYFYTYTVRILNNVVEKLHQHSDLSFVWTEISFFSKWWSSLKNRPHLRDIVKQLVANGQLEIVTGGWVMTDEASVSYFAMVDQLIEGHNWLKTTLGVVPTHSWSVDPFGHSSTFAYILRASGIHNMLIQRTHYAWKQYLAEHRQLNFWWKQTFDKSNSSNVLCQMAPYDLYNIKYTCGPDTEICLQFDFRRIAGEYTDSRSVPITSQNVEEKAELLLSQYGRTGSLFDHNVVLVKLGDDFRFKHEAEWDQQYNNYKKLFRYINSRPDWHAEVRFGTLKDYFNEVHRRMSDINGDSYPTLSGDFFAYGDIYATGKAAYWTGYFTTRPYWKRLSRELEYWLRTSEILYSLSRVILRHNNHTQIVRRLNDDYNSMLAARQSLALFQHHDAITGTSKEAVMHDYGLRLFHGMQQAISLVSYCSQYVLLKSPKAIYHRSFPYLVVDFSRPTYDTLPKKLTLKMSREGTKKIIVFNSLAQRSQQPIRIRVHTPHLELLDSSDQKVPFQINPVWNDTLELLSDVFEVMFIADLPPLSLEMFSIRAIDKMAVNKSSVSILMNDVKAPKAEESVFIFDNLMSDNIVLSSSQLVANFSPYTGFLQSLELRKAGIKKQAAVSIQAYRSEEFSSGAYLFQPNFLQPLKNITGRFPIIRVVRGPIASEITVIYANLVTTTFRLYHSDGPLGAGLETLMNHEMSREETTNSEIFLRVDTDIKNGKVFYVDQNGFQFMKRVFHDHLPIQANYYPATSSLFLEDGDSRLSILMSHSHGVTSPKTGSLEVMLDRRIQMDDGRGMGEGLLDNKRTLSQFWLILERKVRGPAEVPNLSRTGHILSSILGYPAVILDVDSRMEHMFKSSLRFLQASYPCDVHLFNLRTLPQPDDYFIPSNSSLLILHNKGHSCNTMDFSSSHCQEDVKLNSFNEVSINLVESTHLTGYGTKPKLTKLDKVSVPKMEMTTYRIVFS